MLGAVVVLHDVLDDQLLLGAETDGAGGDGLLAPGVADERLVPGGAELGFQCAVEKSSMFAAGAPVGCDGGAREAAGETRRQRERGKCRCESDGCTSAPASQEVGDAPEYGCVHARQGHSIAHKTGVMDHHLPPPLPATQAAYAGEMQLELRHLEAVLEIAEAGSLGRASVRLGVSQPALSAQLRRIERVAGGELFARSRYGVSRHHWASSCCRRLAGCSARWRP